MKIKVYNICKLWLLILISIFQVACLIEEVEQPASIETGSTFTTVLNIAAIAEETTNPHHGVIGVLHPIGWEYESGTFESTDPETPSGNIILDPDSGRKWLCSEAQYLADTSCVDIDTVIGINDGMDWTFLMSDIGDYYGAEAYHEVTLNFNTDNGINGAYPIGYIITVNTWEMIAWLNDADNAEDGSINMTDTSMNHMVEVSGGTNAEITGYYTPSNFSIRENYPNPFNSKTSIDYILPSESNLSLTIYNIDGSMINNRLIRNHPSGKHTYHFNADGLSTGIYIFSIATNNKREHIKMLYLK